MFTFFSSKKKLMELYPYFAIFTADSETGIKDNKHPIECNRFDAEKNNTLRAQSHCVINLTYMN